jgi:hypothetical protein
MLKNYVVLFICAALLSASSTSSAQPDEVVIFRDVNVISMLDDQVLENQDVLVESGRITAIGEDLQAPITAEIVEGNGGYLIPGLADMHVHLDYDPDPNYLVLFIAHGVTTVRNFNASPEHLLWREQVAQGELIGPQIYTSGPGILGLPYSEDLLPYAGSGIVLVAGLGVLLFGLAWAFIIARMRWSPRMRLWIPLYVLVLLIIVGGVYAFQLIPINLFLVRDHQTFVLNEAEARRAVNDQAGESYDFIKPHAYLSPSAFFGVVDEAQQRGLYTVGHMVDTADEAVFVQTMRSGLDEVAHLEEYDFYTGLQNGFDQPQHLDEAAQLTFDNGIKVVTTLVTIDSLAALNDSPDMLFSQSIYRLVRPDVITYWRERSPRRGLDPRYLRNTVLPFYQTIAKAMNDRGVKLLSGTDVGVEGLIPGYSLHRELELLVNAGLTPYQALLSATHNAAEAGRDMRDEADWGTISVGSRADLILLTSNPFEDITATQQRAGVMVRGVWYSQAELDALVEQFVATYNAGQCSPPSRGVVCPALNE